MSKNIVILINESEIAAGTRGASLGPEAIITAARKCNSQVFFENKVQKLQHENHLLEFQTQYPYAKRIDGVLKIYGDLNESVSRILGNNHFPVIVSGDHASAGGTIAGIKTAFPSKKLGVVWIDAHADIHTPFTTPSGNIHGMPLATALAIDNMAQQSNDVDALTASLWNQLKNVGNIAPKINPEDIIYVAVRSTEPQEDAIIAQLGIANFPVSEVRKNGISPIASAINNKLQACDMIYVSFDVDSMDPELTSYATGTPVKNGLTPQEAKGLLVALAENPKVVCLEIVEVNPSLDIKNNRMAETALEVMEAFIKTIKT